MAKATLSIVHLFEAVDPEKEFSDMPFHLPIVPRLWHDNELQVLDVMSGVASWCSPAPARAGERIKLRAGKRVTSGRAIKAHPALHDLREELLWNLEIAGADFDTTAEKGYLPAVMDHDKQKLEADALFMVDTLHLLARRSYKCQTPYYIVGSCALKGNYEPTT